jgi:hypothetical protein
MSRLLNFYRGEGTNTEGRRLVDITAWDDDRWEEVHDFIQSLFPLAESSRFNPDAPLITDEDIAAFQSDELLRANLRKSFKRFLTFLGLAVDEQGKVVMGPNFAPRTPDVWAAPNHNWLRITQVLRCLSVLGLEGEAHALFHWLDGVYSSRRFPILDDTFRYWADAVFQ